MPRSLDNAFGFLDAINRYRTATRFLKQAYSIPINYPTLFHEMEDDHLATPRPPDYEELDNEVVGLGQKVKVAVRDRPHLKDFGHIAYFSVFNWDRKVALYTATVWMGTPHDNPVWVLFPDPDYHGKDIL